MTYLFSREGWTNVHIPCAGWPTSFPEGGTNAQRFGVSTLILVCKVSYLTFAVTVVSALGQGSRCSCLSLSLHTKWWVGCVCVCVFVLFCFVLFCFVLLCFVLFVTRHSRTLTHKHTHTHIHTHTHTQTNKQTHIYTHLGRARWQCGSCWGKVPGMHVFKSNP